MYNYMYKYVYVYGNFPAKMTLERVQGCRKFSKIFKIYSIHRLKVIKVERNSAKLNYMLDSFLAECLSKGLKSLLQVSTSACCCGGELFTYI